MLRLFVLFVSLVTVLAPQASELWPQTSRGGGGGEVGCWAWCCLAAAPGRGAEVQLKH